MKGKFPKFLKRSPSVLGLGPIELLILVSGMFLSQLIGPSPLWGLVLTLGFLGIYKLFSRFIDFKGILLVPYKTESLDWLNERRGHL